ncbi:hypothetical protein [Myxacorys almedinensis]|uniref:Uncharacterized protein n=1 Tax=Myxacorys almedinensis A TaxID=2690445 RepID=A0A8J7Z268_9CYAN|nr:hypothetical protein [Myxacorys almedinensis]NDJ18294.1 hypothetical protein [Myxacorys almedinensis A]
MKTQLLSSPTFNPFKTAARFLTGLSVAAGLLTVSIPAQAAPLQKTQKVAAATAATLPNGVYLYGQSAQPEQLGKAYFVFEVKQGKLIGALYMPRSSFDCTYGAVQPDKVALTVVNSYEKSENPYAIALERNASVASLNNPALLPTGLEGFHQISNLSNTDRRILKVCKAEHQNRVWK